MRCSLTPFRFPNGNAAMPECPSCQFSLLLAQPRFSSPGVAKSSCQTVMMEVAEGAGDGAARSVPSSYSRMLGSATHMVAWPPSAQPREEVERLVLPSGPPARTYPFPLDDFQQLATACIEREESVLVSAHTSAGKTVVAECAPAGPR